MGFTALSALTEQEENLQDKNGQLNQLIKKKNSPENLVGMQIVRFGNELVIAIDRSGDKNEDEDEDNAKHSKGHFSVGYTAYPVKTTGEIDRSTPLFVKTHRNTKIFLENESETVMVDQKDEHGKTYEKVNQGVISETKADNLVLASKTTRIPQQEKVNGKTVYETVILMSKAPGVNLSQLQISLTPEQRIQLAINVLEAYEELHEKGFCQGDIKAENIMVDPKTLQVTIIDLDNSRIDNRVRAPELNVPSPKITKQSDIYALSQNILPYIFSGQYPRSNTPGNIDETVEKGIMIKFAHMAQFDKKSRKADAIIKMLNKMHAKQPEDRLSIQEAKKELKSLLSGDDLSKQCAEQERLEAKKNHQIKLNVLNEVLNSPEYRIDPKYINDTEAVESAFNSTLSEMYILSEDISANIIHLMSHTDNYNEKELKNLVEKFNKTQKNIAILEGGSTCYYLLCDKNVIKPQLINVGTEKPLEAENLNLKTRTHFLCEVLQGIGEKSENINPSNEKPKPSSVNQEKNINANEKLTRLKKFNESFKKDFKGLINIPIVSSILKTLRDISHLFSKKRLEEDAVKVSQNKNAMFKKNDSPKEQNKNSNNSSNVCFNR